MLQFQNYLKTIGLSPKSLKNYKSDMSHFTGWAILKLKALGSYVESLEEITPFLSSKFIREYTGYMLENSTPNKSINRRLSTLRHLSKFLVGSQMIDFNFMDGIGNVGQVKKADSGSHFVIKDFQAHLEAQKISRNTIKNYVSDVNQFLIWLENYNK